MEQKYFDCIYCFDWVYSDIDRLFDKAYKEMLDNVVIDGKPYSPEHIVSGFSDGEHSVRLVFKEGIEPTSLSGFFAETNIVKVRETNIDFSKVTDMSEMFSECSFLVNVDGLHNWDVSNVENMRDMFSECSSLVNLDGLQNWDVSKVENMRDMFSECSSLVNLDGLQNWDVSNVKNMSEMFHSCVSLVNVDGLRNWDVPNVKCIAGMFCYCSKLGPDAFSSDTLKSMAGRKNNLIELIKKGDGIPDEVFKEYKKIKRQIKTRGAYNDILNAEHQAQGKGLKK